MSQVKYTVDHEWLRMEDDGMVTIGLTDFAQAHLGDLVFVRLPEVGAWLAKGDEAVVIESVKAASQVMMPMAGTVTEINETLADDPGKANEDPLGAGWMFKMKVNDAAELNSLMDESAYAAMIKGQA
ncbi:glycine cleavage system protein GcvH [Kitasatospora sp. GP82]|uniref:glycine cleavage system protein GcvH n=1 Tax=Kitasatospora sp. GP82 TaxID=3035089 RepID=UPI00247670D7|nr:glycine cleavage system protein GcvH [Kitasatospora sp. GP82]MDH6128325.1 glycine cleavage system H protein [Kitasatospora sp. GP82]